jgi:hypothetical protein
VKGVWSFAWALIAARLLLYLPKPEATLGLVRRPDETAMERSRPEMLAREPLTRAAVCAGTGCRH